MVRNLSSVIGTLTLFSLILVVLSIPAIFKHFRVPVLRTAAIRLKDGHSVEDLGIHKGILIIGRKVELTYNRTGNIKELEGYVIAQSMHLPIRLMFTDNTPQSIWIAGNVISDTESIEDAEALLALAENIIKPQFAPA